MRTKDESKVEVIFQAALKLILKEGFAGLTMARLAKEAGVATGTLYIYFQNKVELIRALYGKTSADLNYRFLKGYDEELPFLIGLKKIWVNYLTHRIEHFEESVFMELYYRSPFMTDEHREGAESLKLPVHKVLQRGKQEMLIKQDVDDEMLFLAMLGFLRELADEHVTGIYRIDQTKIDQAFQLCWDMIKM